MEARLVCQRKGEPFRRFFSDEHLELYVWLDPGQAVIGFELVYHRPGGAHSLRWQREGGFGHGAVDEGDVVGAMKAAPVVRRESAAVEPELSATFAARSQEIEPEIARFVQAKLDMYLSAVDPRAAIKRG